MPGAAYDSACDVNHDGAVNVLDVQLAAGHWNQIGTWLSDNSHNHLGQVWTGNSPLEIQGAFGAPYYAPLVLGNIAGVGLSIGASESGVYIYSAGYHGLWVASAGNNGVHVGAAGQDGLFICRTGTADSCTPDATTNNGVEIGNAQHNGMRVISAGWNGVVVDSAGGNGMYVGSAGFDGVYVYSAGENGVQVVSAGMNGVYANTTQASGQWGFYTDDAIHGSNVLMHSLSLVAQVSGPNSLAPGDIVAVAGVTDPVSGSTVHTPLVRLAGASFPNIVGVVESHLALTQHPNRSQPTEGETDSEASPPVLHSVDGPAQAATTWRSP